MNIGYKKIQKDYIVKLQILGLNNEFRKGIKPENVPFAKYRCDKAKVLDIYHMNNKEKKIKKGYGLHDITFCYKLGEIVSVKNFDTNVESICSNGIHYFLGEEPAYYWNNLIDNGEYKQWHDNGEICGIENYKNGILDGEWKKW